MSPSVHKGCFSSWGLMLAVRHLHIIHYPQSIFLSLTTLPTAILLSRFAESRWQSRSSKPYQTPLRIAWGALCDIGITGKNKNKAKHSAVNTFNIVFAYSTRKVQLKSHPSLSSLRPLLRWNRLLQARSHITLYLFSLKCVHLLGYLSIDCGCFARKAIFWSLYMVGVFKSAQNNNKCRPKWNTS